MSITGEYVPQYIQRDGTTSDRAPYRSLLTQNWDIYVVNGTVTETSRGGSVSNDEVQYQVTQSKNFKGVSYGLSSIYPQAGNGVTETLTLKKGSTDADSYLNVYTKALIQSDDYNDDTLIYIENSDKNTTETFVSNLYSSYEEGSSYDTLRVRRSATTSQTTSYRLSTDWQLIVNGVQVASAGDSDVDSVLETYISEANPGMDVTLTDYPTNGSSSADGYYDVISVDYYVVAVVDQIQDEEDATTIYFKDASIGVAAIEVKKDDDDYSYTFTKDGAAINATDLAENDVLSIVCALPTGSADAASAFEDSLFYDVTVAQATAEGQVTSTSTNSYGETTYTIGGTEYVCVADMAGTLSTGDQYVVYMTADGRIAYAEKLASAINYGILDIQLAINDLINIGDLLIHIDNVSNLRCNRVNSEIHSVKDRVSIIVDRVVRNTGRFISFRVISPVFRGQRDLVNAIGLKVRGFNSIHILIPAAISNTNL